MSIAYFLTERLSIYTTNYKHFIITTKYKQQLSSFSRAKKNLKPLVIITKTTQSNLKLKIQESLVFITKRKLFYGREIKITDQKKKVYRSFHHKNLNLFTFTDHLLEKPSFLINF